MLATMVWFFAVGLLVLLGGVSVLTARANGDDEWVGTVLTAVGAAMLAVAATMMVQMSAASARDLGQWTNSDPETKAWYRALMRPDPGFTSGSCCGDADAYWCDDVSVDHGRVFCAITDDRDDGPLKRPHRPIGEKHEIPPSRMKFGPGDPQPNLGNPTGHAIIFLGSRPTDWVLCFVPNGGT